MKILQIFNSYLEYSGEECSVHRIASALRERFEVTEFHVPTADFIQRPFSRMQMPFLMLRNPSVLDRLRKLQHAEKFDYWQIHNVFPAISVATYELASELGVPLIQYLHNYRFGCLNATYFRAGKACRDCKPQSSLPGISHGCWRGSRLASASMATALNRAWSRGSIDQIKSFIALSEAQKVEHLAMGIPDEKITVIPHFLDASETPATTVNPEGDVIFIGRISEEKGVELLLRAWKGVESRGRCLRIVGDGPKLSEMQALAKKLKLKNVVFNGFVPREDHPELWKQASFLAAPSQWLEPFGMAILEAWSQARPVLATNVGSFPEMMTHGQNAWLAEPSVDCFTEALQVALDAGSQVLEIGKNGRHTLEQKYNRKLWLDQIDQFYQSQMSDPRS